MGHRQPLERPFSKLGKVEGLECDLICSPRAQMPTPDQVGLLMQFCDATSDAQIKVKCIGTLECLAQHPESVEANMVSATPCMDSDCLERLTMLEQTIANYLLSMMLITGKDDFRKDWLAA
jgi:hypothetical protein